MTEELTPFSISIAVRQLIRAIVHTVPYRRELIRRTRECAGADWWRNIRPGERPWIRKVGVCPSLPSVTALQVLRRVGVQSPGLIDRVQLVIDHDFRWLLRESPWLRRGVAVRSGKRRVVPLYRATSVCIPPFRRPVSLHPIYIPVSYHRTRCSACLPVPSIPNYYLANYVTL